MIWQFWIKVRMQKSFALCSFCAKLCLVAWSSGMVYLCVCRIDVASRLSSEIEKLNVGVILTDSEVTTVSRKCWLPDYLTVTDNIVAVEYVAASFLCCRCCPVPFSTRCTCTIVLSCLRCGSYFSLSRWHEARGTFVKVYLMHCLKILCHLEVCSIFSWVYHAVCIWLWLLLIICSELMSFASSLVVV